MAICVSILFAYLVTVLTGLSCHWGSDVVAAVLDECSDAGSNIVSTSLGRGGKSATRCFTFRLYDRANSITHIHYTYRTPINCFQKSVMILIR